MVSTRIMICGALAWAQGEAQEIFKGLAEIVVSLHSNHTLNNLLSSFGVRVLTM
jgi:hypothetical protein